MSAGPAAGCVLCEQPGGRVVHATARWRLVHADEPGLPAFWRLVWNGHVKEFTQLPRESRIECMDVLAVMESCVLSELRPDKVNLASLGNAVPHLHWHVVARFAGDAWWPGAVWSPSRNVPDAALLADLPQRLSGVEARMLEALQRLP